MPGSERAYDKRSHMLVYAGAVTFGLLAALALQIYLSAGGFDLGALWEGLMAAKGRQLRTTGPWWAIAAMAFAVSGATAAALSRLPFPWRRFRPLRWGLGSRDRFPARARMSAIPTRPGRSRSAPAQIWRCGSRHSGSQG